MMRTSSVAQFENKNFRISDEFSDLDFKDERLNKRMIQVVEAFSGAPDSSIPKACGAWAAAAHDRNVDETVGKLLGFMASQPVAGTHHIEAPRKNSSPGGKRFLMFASRKLPSNGRKILKGEITFWPNP